uniref:Uncharacterized protein n=1 Tax=Setaria viridis TaxID=4556 RepID=A0A4U6SWR7_SETVI|nr:hypothetical protein SEVIR_9G119550v2 [Setaria viridis]
MAVFRWERDERRQESAEGRATAAGSLLPVATMGPNLAFYWRAFFINPPFLSPILLPNPI